MGNLTIKKAFQEQPCSQKEKYVNLEYRLPNGKPVRFLDDNAAYLGNQLECEKGGNRCFGTVANMDFILIAAYEENGENPELVMYRKR